jgi:hypothetical protein
VPDTLERLHSVVQEGIGTPPPLAALRRRARRSARLRRMPSLALVAASIIAVVAVAVAYGGSPGSRSQRPQPSPRATHRGATLKYTVDTAATPDGWAPVDWGDAQISVPAAWRVEVEHATCSRELKNEVLLDPLQAKGLCLMPLGTWATLAPLPDRYSSGHPTTVNGIRVFVTRLGSSADEYAPSLHVALYVRGPAREARQILDSLTHSPRQIVLEAGPRPVVAGTWRRVSFEGMSLRVPPEDGAPVTVSIYPPATQACTTLQALANSLVFDGDRGVGIYHCPFPFTPDAWQLARETGAGVEVDARPQALDGYVSGLSRHCDAINGLRLCPYAKPATGILAVRVSSGGLAHPLLVLLGLDGGGMTARTILYSLRPA